MLRLSCWTKAILLSALRGEILAWFGFNQKVTVCMNMRPGVKNHLTFGLSWPVR